MAYVRLISHLLGCAVILASALKESDSHYLPPHGQVQVNSHHTAGSPLAQLDEEKLLLTTNIPKFHAGKAALEKNGCTCQHHGQISQCTCNVCKSTQVQDVQASESKPEYSTYITRPAHVINYLFNSPSPSQAPSKVGVGADDKKQTPGGTRTGSNARLREQFQGLQTNIKQSYIDYLSIPSKPIITVEYSGNENVEDSSPTLKNNDNKFIKQNEYSYDGPRHWFGQGDIKYNVPTQGERHHYYSRKEMENIGQQNENFEHKKTKRNVGNIVRSEDGSDESGYVSIGRLDANDLRDRQKRETFYVDPALINNDYQYNQKNNEYFGPTQVNPEVQFAKRESEYYDRPVQANNDYQYNQKGNEYYGQSQASPDFEYTKRESDYGQAQVNNDYQYNARYEGGRPLEPEDGFHFNKRGIDNVNPAQSTGEYQYNKRYDTFIDTPNTNNDYQNKRQTEYYRQPNQANRESPYNKRATAFSGRSLTSSGNEPSVKPSTQVQNEYEFTKRNVPVYYIDPEQTNAQYQYHKRDSDRTVTPQMNRVCQHNKRNVHYPKPENVKFAHRAKKTDKPHVGKDQKRKYRHTLEDVEFIEPAPMGKGGAYKRDTEYANAGALSGEQPSNTADSVAVPAQGDAKNVDKDGAVLAGEGSETATPTPDEDSNKTEEAHKGRKKHKKKKHEHKRGKSKHEGDEVKEENEENEENEELESAATEDAE